jgi:hypothetical protein
MIDQHQVVMLFLFGSCHFYLGRKVDILVRKSVGYIASLFASLVGGKVVMIYSTGYFSN